jgi:tetraacyldisaccharide 4'-kinase
VIHSRLHRKGSCVPLEEPGWWYQDRRSVTADVLRPFAWAVGRVAERRFRTAAQPYKSRLPVICIGNFTAGGTGKTPMALEVGRMLRASGTEPVYLTRGYGGAVRGPHRVDLARDAAADVGDEVLLLAKSGAAFVARDRAAGAAAIEAAQVTGTVPGSAIVMDDGLQNPSLAKDLTVALLDGRRGIGNGLVIPAGPLRASLAFQLPLVDAIVVNGPGPGGGRGQLPSVLAAAFSGPVLFATVTAAATVDWVRDRPIVAFAGIGNPARFYDLLRTCGGTIAETVTFADHKPLTEADARRILDLAQRHKAVIVTTEKDMVRLSGTTGAARQEVLAVARPLPIRLQFSDADAAHLHGLLAAAVAKRATATT